MVEADKLELTGDESERNKETDFNRNVLGVQSYSVKLGNKYYAYDWAQPTAATLAIVADFMDGKESDDESGAGQDILNAFRAGESII